MTPVMRQARTPAAYLPLVDAWLAGWRTRYEADQTSARWTLFDITFRTPDEREITWTRFAPSMAWAIDDFRALLIREFPNGQGGTWARLKRVAPHD
jgi:hypothetical protein